MIIIMIIFKRLQIDWNLINRTIAGVHMLPGRITNMTTNFCCLLYQIKVPFTAEQVFAKIL